MARSRILVAYDISSDARRTAVFQLLNDFGDRLQYSVFLCEVNDREAIDLRCRLSEAIHHDEDSVVLVGLGPAAHDVAEKIDTLGKPRLLKERVVVV